MPNGARMVKRSRVLVTGGAGFIGRRVVRALLAQGHEVTVADLRVFPDPAVRSVVGDLCDPDGPARAVSPGTDVIIHLAAVTSVLASVADPVSTERAVLRPLTPYGATKAAAEMLIGSYANCYGITGASLRFSNVYGPG